MIVPVAALTLVTAGLFGALALCWLWTSPTTTNPPTGA